MTPKNATHSSREVLVFLHCRARMRGVCNRSIHRELNMVLRQALETLRKQPIPATPAPANWRDNVAKGK